MPTYLFNQFEAAVQALATIPNLIDLKINLSSEEEAIFILEQIPSLEMLNGSPTNEEEEADEGELNEQSDQPEVVEHTDNDAQLEYTDQNEQYEENEIEDNREDLEYTEENHNENEHVDRQNKAVEREGNFSVDIDANEADALSLNQAIPSIEVIL